jgi:hypothetical protein
MSFSASAWYLARTLEIWTASRMIESLGKVFRIVLMELALSMGQPGRRFRVPVQAALYTEDRSMSTVKMSVRISGMRISSGREYLG